LEAERKRDTRVPEIQTVRIIEMSGNRRNPPARLGL